MREVWWIAAVIVAFFIASYFRPSTAALVFCFLAALLCGVVYLAYWNSPDAKVGRRQRREWLRGRTYRSKKGKGR